MSASRFLTRSTLRLATAPRATKNLLPLGSIRGLAISAPNLKHGTGAVRETEVPISVYTPDAKGVGSNNAMHGTIPVRQEDGRAASTPGVPAPNNMENLGRLRDDVFDRLPATVKAMTVKDKVIVITG